MKKRIFKRLTSLLTSAAMTAAVFTTFAVPVSAEPVDKEASTTVTQTAAAAVNAIGANITKPGNDRAGDVRMTAAKYTDAELEDLGAAIGVFKLGQVKAGSQVTVTAKLSVTAVDLSGVGLYTTNEEITSSDAASDYKTVMAGNALSEFGAFDPKGNYTINDKKLEKTTFGGTLPTGDTGLKFDDTHLGTITYTAPIEADGYLYFLAGAWQNSATGTGTRQTQVVDISVEYSDTLANTVEYAAADETVNVLKDLSIGNRLTIGKNLTISAAEEKVTVTGNASPGGILVNQGKEVEFDNINIKASGNNNAVAVAAGSTLTIKNATITGDVYQENGNNCAVNLENVEVTGTVKTRKGNDGGDTSNTYCAVILKSTQANAVKYYYGEGKDTLTMDANSSIGTLTIYGTPALGDVVVKAEEGAELDPAKITTLVIEGTSDKEYVLEKTDGGLVLKEKLTVATTPQPNTLTYTGEAQALVTAGEASEGGKMQYSLTGQGDWQDTVPTGTEAKDYTVYYKAVPSAGNEANYTDSEVGNVKVTINKADSQVEVSPQPEGSVTYGDTLTLTAKVSKADAAAGISLMAEDQVVFKAGNTTLGTETVTYSDDGAKSEGTATLTLTIDKTNYNAIQAASGTITAEYGGSVNLNNSNSSAITVNVTPKTLTYTATAMDRKYDENNTTVDVTLTPTNADGDDVTLKGTGTIADANAGNGKAVTIKDVTIEGADKDYYQAATAPIEAITVNIEKAESAITETPTAAQGLVYTGAALNLLATKGTATGGELQYKVDDGTYSTAEPTAITAGEHTVWYKVVENENYNSIAETSIKVTIEKAKEETPNIEINYSEETLTGFDGGEYTIGGNAVSPDGGKLSAKEYMNSTISIVKKASDTNHDDSDAQSLPVPARPGIQVSLSGVAPTEAGGMGRITGTTAEMEYRAKNDGEWADCSAEATEVAPGTYEVRTKATDNAFASETVTVTVGEYVVPGTCTVLGTITADNHTVNSVKLVPGDGTDGKNETGYSFKGVKPGMYNIVVTYDDNNTKTVFVEIPKENEGIITENIEIKEEEYSSSFENTSDKDITVNGLEDAAKDKDITMEVSDSTDLTAQSAIKTLANTMAGVMDFIDITLTSGGEGISVLDNALDIYIPFNGAVKAVYRYHDNEAEVITKGSTGTDGEWYEQVGKYIHIHANKFSTYAMLRDEVIPPETDIAETATIRLEDKDGDHIWDIVLYPDKKGEEETYIRRYMSAELTFEMTLDGEKADPADYEIMAYGESSVTKLEGEKFGFNMNGEPYPDVSSAEGITIGRVEITAYGEYTLSITEGIVRTAENANNIVHTYNSAAEGEGKTTLSVPNGEEGVASNPSVSGEKSPEKVPLKINVIFPNKVSDQAKEYMDMTINIDSAMPGSAKEIKLGSDFVDTEAITVERTKFNYMYSGITPAADGDIEGYLVTTDIEVPDGGAARYTISISGKGYRRYSKDIIVNSDSEGVTVNIWNNYMDEPMITVVPDDEKWSHFTFLAGDIIEDGNINLYDLSAGASYFGKINMETNPTDNADFIRYDLNRDGNIDSRDIAMILVSWGK